MKKLFLLLTAGLTAMGASAQLSTNLKMTSQQAKYPWVEELNPKKVYGAMPRTKTMQTANKGTATTNGGWWSFNDANDPGTFTQYDGTTNTGNYGAVTMYTDSNAYVPTGSPAPFYWWCHGLGVSFDPLSPYFNGLYQPTDGSVAPFIENSFDSTTGYWVDSIFTIGSYVQIATSAVDTLYIEMTYNSDTNAYLLVISNALVATYGITALPDTTYGFANVHYNAALNRIASDVPHTIRITKLLDAAAAIDTISTGWNAWAFPTGGLWVPKGKKVIVYEHMEPQTPAAFGDDLSTLNRWVQQSWRLNDPYQVDKDNSSGLISTSAERHATADAWDYSGKPILAPTYTFTSPLSVLNPYFQLYIRQTSTVGVNNTAANVKASVYPNPAKTSVSIAFNVTNSTDVTVSLTNIMGQEVATQTIANATNDKATFDVSKLADGVYMYTVKANGQQTTGRVVVAH